MSELSVADYRPPKALVDDWHAWLAVWIGADADRGTAIVAWSVSPALLKLSPELRDAVLDRFPVVRDPVAGQDFLPDVQVDADDCTRCGPACVCDIKGEPVMFAKVPAEHWEKLS